MSRLKIAALLCAIAAVLAVVVGQSAIATHEPANKAAAASSNVDEFDDTVVLLRERIKVSSPFDLILQLTSECSIITELTTGGTGPQDESTASGQVELWITIDGKTVPVSTADSNPQQPGTQTDDGRIVFCNRAYGRKVQDADGDGDVDRQDDYIRTRTANAFNWLALDTGVNYDSPANGNNILDVVVHGRFTTSTTGRAVADAWVGRRSLIIEPTNASNHEQVTPQDAESGTTAIPIAPPTP